MNDPFMQTKCSNAQTSLWVFREVTGALHLLMASERLFLLIPWLVAAVKYLVLKINITRSPPPSPNRPCHRHLFG